jgi:SAM-dependent methyltransferase
VATLTTPPRTPDDARLRGPARVRELWKRFRNEKADPEPFYSMLASEAVAKLEARHGPMAGKTVVDVGCGPGFYTEALRARGATVLPLEYALEELRLAGDPPAGAIVADAAHMPFRSAGVDAVFCSNMLEHASDTEGVLADIERILRPGGWAYVSWTNWYSPWGGHDITPYQFLGPKLGPRLYERRHGPPPKNVPGEGLFPVHVGPTLRLVRDRPGLRLDRAEPRYWSWASFLTKVPGAREVLCWNCVIHLTKVGP